MEYKRRHWVFAYAQWLLWGALVFHGSRIARDLYWAVKRAEKRLAHRLIRALARRYYWHDTILDTDAPNVRGLKVKHLTVVNAYGQVHTIR